VGDLMVRGASIYYGGLRALGATALHRRLRDAGLILCYHNVVPDDDGIGDPGLHMPLARFERQMHWLRAHYEVVSLHELTRRLTSGASLRSVAAVTFDDGYAGAYQHAVPVLTRLGIPATVFVVTEAVGRSAGFWWDQPAIVASATPARRARWLDELGGDGAAILSGDGSPAEPGLPASHRPASWATIRAHLGDGIDVGVHSATHRSLPALGDAELEREIVTSRAALQRATGILSPFFAYPYGRWDARVRAAVSAAGYRAGLTLDYGLNDASADPRVLRRVNAPARIPDSAFDVWTAGLHLLRRA
jgi:peptidoglycan/xylan/chitin deacetylase (PgdA/CDA1 family)